MRLGLLLALLVGSPEHDRDVPDPASFGVQVDWRAPAECPDAATFLRQLSGTVGRPLHFDPQATASLHANVVHDVGTAPVVYRLELTTAVEDQIEIRSLEAAECDDLIEASALVAALTLEPFARPESGRVPEPQPTSVEIPDARPATPVPQSESATKRVESRAAHQHPTPPSRRPTPPNIGAAFVDAGLGIGTTTTIAGGLIGGLGWQRGRARIEVSARHWFARRTRSSPGSQLFATAAGLHGCFVPQTAHFEFPLCGGVSAGALTARGTGTAVAPQRQTVPWLAILTRAGVAWPVTPWLALRGGAELAAVPSRAVFHVKSANGDRRVYAAPPVNARLTLGVELRFFRK